MIFLPIVERELRVAARRPGTYWMRLTAALTALVVLASALILDLLSFSPSQKGSELFGLLSGFAFVVALFIGLHGSSDALCSEKREGTLGLLFLTDLKGYDVVLGKLTATALGAFYGMLAVLPMLAIPLLMGGVSAAAFWRTVLVLLNTLFFSLAGGMFVSAISRYERKARAGTLLLLLAFTGGLPLVGSGFSEWIAANGVVPIGFLLPSPAFAFFLARTSTIMPVWRSAEFWSSLLLTHLLSWLLLLLAARIAPRVWRDKPASLKRLRWREWWRNLILGNAVRRNAFRTRLLEINPIFWLSSRERQTVSYPWIFLGCLGVIWIWGWWLDRGLWGELGLALFLTYGLHLFMKSWVLTFACNGLGAGPENGALELLLSTPLTVSDLLRGQWLGLRRQFAAPIAAILLIDLLWLALGLKKSGVPRAGQESFLFSAFIANLAMFVADLFTLAWVGMWMGIRSNRASQAAAATMARVLVLPWLLFALAGMMIVSFGWTFLGIRPVAYPGFIFPMLWLSIGLVIDFVWGRQAYLKLHRDLRVGAMRLHPRKFSLPSEGRSPG